MPARHKLATSRWSWLAIIPTCLAKIGTLGPRARGLWFGNPTQASAAFSAVFASALANGGSLDLITPGVSYFKKLHSVGNFVPVTARPARAGRRPPDQLTM